MKNRMEMATGYKEKHETGLENKWNLCKSLQLFIKMWYIGIIITITYLIEGTV